MRTDYLDLCRPISCSYYVFPLGVWGVICQLPEEPIFRNSLAVLIIILCSLNHFYLFVKQMFYTVFFFFQPYSPPLSLYPSSYQLLIPPQIWVGLHLHLSFLVDIFLNLHAQILIKNASIFTSVLLF